MQYKQRVTAEWRGDTNREKEIWDRPCGSDMNHWKQYTNDFSNGQCDVQVCRKARCLVSKSKWEQQIPKIQHPKRPTSADITELEVYCVNVVTHRKQEFKQFYWQFYFNVHLTFLSSRFVTFFSNKVSVNWAWRSFRQDNASPHELMAQVIPVQTSKLKISYSQCTYTHHFATLTESVLYPLSLTPALLFLLLSAPPAFNNLHMKLSHTTRYLNVKV